MVYLISNTYNEFLQQHTDIILPGTIEDALQYFEDKECIAVDTETTGFDVHNCKLLTLQLGDFDNQFVINATELSIQPFKELLENKQLILQNAKFDLRFFYKQGIFPTHIFDTFLAETKLNQGLPNVRKNLEALAVKYCSTTKEVDKSLRPLIHRLGLVKEVIMYAANDVKYLHQIKEKQIELAKQQNMLQAFNLENRFVPVLAYVEYCGIYIDELKWIAKTKQSYGKLNEARAALNKYTIDHKLVNIQLDLFSPIPTIDINWSSDQQVKQLFKRIGINVQVFEKGVRKESVEAPVLIKQIKDFDIIPIYLDYKKWEKDYTTYGTNFLKHINKSTGRIHTNFTQIVDTGRMASGGKNKITKEEYVNLQNIPATPEDKEKIKGMIYARECFIPQEYNWVYIDADYSGQEQIVLANKSQDKDLIEFYKKNLGDMHAYIASKIFPELKDISLKDIKKFHKEKRQIAKSAGFALNYGGSGYTISNNLNIPREQGDFVEKAYFEAFPGLKQYYDTCEGNTLKNGYILVDELTGSKFYIAGFDKFKTLQSEVNSQKWGNRNKEQNSYYLKWKGQIRRNALNFPIQGSSASITKYACILLYDWLLENKYQNIVKIVNVIHDEILIECPKDLADTTSNVLQNCMEKAGNLYCTIIPLKASSGIFTHWEH
jgi:DNA polymerase-1